MNMKVDYTNGPADEIALYRPKGAGRTVLDDKLGITERNNFIENNSSPLGTGGLAETSISPVKTKIDPPGSSNGSSGDGSKVLKEEGMSRGMANFQAGAGIGLGLLSFLENRKTSKLQREALKHDIDTAKEHRANRQALGASFSAGLASGLGGGTK